MAQDGQHLSAELSQPVSADLLASEQRPAFMDVRQEPGEVGQPQPASVTAAASPPATPPQATAEATKDEHEDVLSDDGVNVVLQLTGIRGDVRKQHPTPLAAQ